MRIETIRPPAVTIDGATAIVTACYGKRISSAALDEDALRIGFTTGETLILTQSHLCCERRYWQTDDDLSVLVGGKLREIIVKPASGAWPEVSFLTVCVEGTCIDVKAYNEHSGYYSGFDFEAELLTVN